MFIELHLGDWAVMVNIQHIIKIEMKSYQRAAVVMIDGETLDPNESYDEVIELLADALGDMEDLEEV